MDLEEYLRRYGGRRSRHTGSVKDTTRKHRIGVASGTPRAVFKVISKGSGNRSLSNLASYISDKNKKVIETESGTVSNEDELKELRDSWLKDFEHGRKTKRSIDFVHMVVSAPAGEDRDACERAAYRFIRTTFSDRRWMAVRHDNTDNPHVHIVVQNRNVENKPLPLKKSDLLDYRAVWAKSCQSERIDVISVSRVEAGVLRVAPKIEMVKMKEAGKSIYHEIAKEEDGYTVPTPILKGHITALVKNAADYVDESNASTPAQENERVILMKHAHYLMRQALSLAVTEAQKRTVFEAVKAQFSVKEAKTFAQETILQIT